MCLSHLWRRSPKIQSEESRIEEQSNVLPLHQPQQSYAPPPLANAEARPSQGPSEQSPAQTIFAQANNFHLEHFHYNQYDGQQRQGNSGWEQLLKATSTNALHNSIARFDPPKCDENTRVELIREIGTWIEDRHLSTQLLCMTGAAGSGKSALQQTLAEACVAKGILAASFFFNTGDNTRNNVSRIIPTLAYQLGQKNNALRRMIGIAVEDDALIFNQTLRTQIEKLILNPVTHLPPSELASLPYAIIIDGLDECKEERDQRTLLRAIHECFLGRRSPFRIFLASRPELAIFEALEPGGHLHGIIYPIRLSDDYDATSDIRLTLRRNFTEIGLRRRWEHAWFTEADIEAIVTAASGQYIYAATVIRYVSEPRRSPVERLRTILSSQSGTGSGTKPFALLDLLYTLVLNNAREGYEAIDNRHDFLLVLRVYLALNDLNLGLGISRQDQLLGLEEGTYESILCDLRSLLIAQPTLRRGHQIRVYHKSFLDYLNTPERAGPLYTPFSRYVEYITRCCLRRIDSYSLKPAASVSLMKTLNFGTKNWTWTCWTALRFYALHSGGKLRFLSHQEMWKV
ncbi:hypothetical protein DFP72DRAFT_432678 [Ephemerocybe angulata]|uniref:Nephrocystin 3-like N-terminal domain-containing protein n=1 Tax=Ephemerocybe angulata TaxID=980116 RepID=A0A8H6HTJ4_9AGAR|nr:hypothetical protein DFP72DRAFT_432678 [Tulosesus angulatus]